MQCDSSCLLELLKDNDKEGSQLSCIISLPNHIHILMSKLVPQPQLLVAKGLSTILNWLPINSIV